MRKRLRTVSSVIALLAALAPREALACPVCFGQSDSLMAVSTNNGIMTLMVVILAVLAAFASFFVYLARRARFAEAVASTETARIVADPQEGTAQC